MRACSILFVGSLSLVLACGGGHKGNLDGGGNGDGDGAVNGTDDGGGSGTADGGGNNGNGDGGVIGPANCTPGDTECTDCIDNDGNGRIDGFDPTCTSAADDDEGSFATGLPGDNKDQKQDCFFDGDSGKAPNGMDDCIYDSCCFFDSGCDPSCTVTQDCVDFCAGHAVPGCDCFGCCTLCDADGCVDVVTNTDIAPDCTYDAIHDTEKCPTCTKNDQCGSDCDPDNCILCPGQTPDDLPSDCTGGNECPDGNTPCTGNSDCDVDTEYCSNGCCVSQVIVN